MKEQAPNSRASFSNWQDPPKRQKQKGVTSTPLTAKTHIADKLKVSTTFRVSAVAIDFDCTAGAFT